ncbi:MAG: hypothetical protein AVO35_08450 [Candidatus Aegiribacteria sp. MLS_C]|nr:MAG: hypothetical protein AVO35_08450 [Candidatus Aegiribacteria sp. MLS_C]
MILLLPVLLLWLCGFLVLWRVPLCSAWKEGRPDCGTLSLIIPARNEEDSLPALLRSLGSEDTGPLEIIVVDDGSTDRTAE